jgi:hydroxybutyrate-dimer hydrolase
MNKIGASLRLGLLAAAMSVALSGCNNATGGSADVAETIVGIASDGIGLANATVDIIDSRNQSITGIATDANGRFHFNPGTAFFPFMMTVKANGQSYYSLVTESDRQVNINAATTAIAQLALGTTQLSTAYATTAFKKLTADKLAEAESLYLRTMREDSLLAASLFDVSPRTKDYNPGNALADGDAYQQYMAMVEPSLSALDGRLLLLNKKPYRFSNYNTVTRAASDDLLTAGLDDVGMRGPAPGYPSSMGLVSATELRRNAIYNAYHALTDLTFPGGYGSLWARVSKVPGVEYLGYADTGDGSRNVSTLVQIPDSFDKQRPCLIVVPSANLSGVYTANPTAEWGLLHGCAVAVTDKGAGNGAEYIDSSSSYEIDGIIGSSQGATSTLQFKTGYSSDVRLPFINQYPGRFAFKFSQDRKSVV